MSRFSSLGIWLVLASNCSFPPAHPKPQLKYILSPIFCSGMGFAVIPRRLLHSNQSWINSSYSISTSSGHPRCLCTWLKGGMGGGGGEEKPQTGPQDISPSLSWLQSQFHAKQPKPAFAPTPRHIAGLNGVYSDGEQHHSAGRVCDARLPLGPSQSHTQSDENMPFCGATSHKIHTSRATSHSFGEKQTGRWKRRRTAFFNTVCVQLL